VIDSRRLRAELERLLADQTHEVRDQAQRVADETWARVLRGEDASQAVAGAMDALGIEGAMRDQLGRGVVQGLLSGAGMLPEIALTAGALDLFAARALVMSWDSTGMSLSTRLHGSLGTVQADVRHVVASAISRRDNAWKTARRIYDGYGFGGALNRASLADLPRDLRQLVDASRLALLPPDSEALRREVAKLTRYAESLKTNALRASYRQLVDKLQGDLGRGLEKAVRAAVEEKTRYFAERILRTETARAWGQGFFAQVNDDPDAVGIEWNTSSAHLVFDICDFHARADLFGMGPGVYPKSRLPRYPAHPHCLCAMTVVYTAPAPRDQVEAGGKAALDSMTDSQQARLLTWTGKQGFDGSGSWQGSLRQWQAPGGAPMSPGAKAILQEARQASRRLDPAALDQAWKDAKGGPELAQWRRSGKPLPPGLDEREAAMIFDYTGSRYRGLNASMRSGNPSAADLARVQIIDSGLEGMGLRRHETLFRGISIAASDMKSFQKSMRHGAAVEWPSLTSTSVRRKESEHFGDVSFVISRARATDVSGISQHASEAEALIPSMFRGKVSRVVSLSKGKMIIFVEAS